MLSARVTAFTVSELLKENHSGRGVQNYYPLPLPKPWPEN